MDEDITMEDWDRAQRILLAKERRLADLEGAAVHDPAKKREIALLHAQVGQLRHEVDRLLKVAAANDKVRRAG